MDARTHSRKRRVPSRLRHVGPFALLAIAAVLIGGNFTCAGVTVGTQQYGVPAGAIVVAPNGNDGAAGTAAAPMRTLGAAVSRARSGGTIVLRAGTYHESVVIPDGKRLTVQGWPRESAWMDGSVRVTNWVASGGRWRSDNWRTEFDTSPTYSRGAPDNVAANWRFVNPSYPMAAYPDQIWINGVAQRQVGSLGAVVAGTFFHDRAANQLWLGSNPAGRTVQVSDLVRALMVRSEGSVLRGFGVRRYAPSVPDMGAVTIERSGVLVEAVAITDNATTGLHVGSGTVTNVRLRNLSLLRNGMLGMSASNADNLRVEHVWAERNNTERFNEAPVSGGAKIVRSRGVLVRNSIFRANAGPGLWMDESVYNITITGSELADNSGHGTSLELSSKAVFANNVVRNNGGFGIKINNTSNVSVWNNTFIGNDRSINLVQDNRRPTSASTAGRDPRQPFPDPTMTWLNGPAVFANNVVANQRSGNCMICVEDYSHQRSAAQIGVTTNSNVYNRPNTGSPALLVVWSRGPGDPAVYTTLTAFRAATGQERSGQLINGTGLLDRYGRVIRALSTSTAQPLPAAIASAVGHSVGARYNGAWIY